MRSRILLTLLLSLLACERRLVDTPPPTATNADAHNERGTTARAPAPPANSQGAEELVNIPPFPWTTLDFHCQLQSKPGAPEYSLLIGRDSTVIAAKQILLSSSEVRKSHAELTLKQAQALAHIWIALDARNVKEQRSDFGGYCRVRLEGPNKVVVVDASPSSHTHEPLGDLYRFIHRLHSESKVLASTTPITPLDEYNVDW